MSYISLLIAGILGSKKKSMPERDLGYQAQNPSFTHEETETSESKSPVLTAC